MNTVLAAYMKNIAAVFQPEDSPCQFYCRQQLQIPQQVYQLYEQCHLSKADHSSYYGAIIISTKRGSSLLYSQWHNAWKSNSRAIHSVDSNNDCDSLHFPKQPRIFIHSLIHSPILSLPFFMARNCGQSNGACSGIDGIMAAIRSKETYGRSKRKWK